MHLFRAALGLSSLCLIARAGAQEEIKIGMVGLDTSHVAEFAGFFNDPANAHHIAGARVVCAFKGGSPDVAQSASRVDGFTQELREKYHVEIVASIAEVIARSDAIMIESVDGRAHLAEAREIFPAGKPVFIEKPLGGNLSESIRIARLAKQYGTALYTSDVARTSPGILELRTAKVGRMRSVISCGNGTIEPHVPDLYYEGIHPVEALYGVLGMGCVSVTRTFTPDSDVTAGVWSGGKTGVVLTTRNGRAPESVTVYGSSAILEKHPYKDFPGFARQILNFFHTRQAPVSIDDSLEVLAFCQAADESKAAGGVPVALADTMGRATAQADTPDEPLAAQGELLFSDDFTQPPLGTSWRVGAPTFAVANGVLKGTHTFLGSPATADRAARPSHGAVAMVPVGRKDFIIEFKFRTDSEAVRVNAVCDDTAYKLSHGGHIVRVALSPTRMLLQDDKVVLSNDLEEMRKDPARKAEFDRRMAGSARSIPYPFAPRRWYRLRMEVVGDRLRVSIDGHPAGFLQSPGLAHPSKTRFHFTVSDGTAEFDDFRLWAAAEH